MLATRGEVARVTGRRILMSEMTTMSEMATTGNDGRG